MPIIWLKISQSCSVHCRKLMRFCEREYYSTIRKLSSELNSPPRYYERVSKSNKSSFLLSSSTDMSTSSNSPLSLTYRWATLDDYEAIMDIGRNLFDGLDYLPATYKNLTRDPSWTGICAIHDGKVIAYGGGHLLNNGESVMLRSGRVLKEYRAQGVIAGTIKVVADNYLRNHPTIKEYYSTLKSDSFLLGKDMYSRIEDQVFKRDAVAFKVSKAQVGRDVPDTDSSVVDLSKTQLIDIFTNCSNLFVDGFVNPRYVFMQPIVDNVDLLYRLADQRCASYSQQDVCDVLTFGVHFPCTAGYVYHMECYGDTLAEKLRPHLYKHLSMALAAVSHVKKDIDLYFFLYGRRGDYNFSWLSKELPRLRATPYNLSYEYYIGLRTMLPT